MSENCVKGAMLLNSVVLLRRLKQAADGVETASGATQSPAAQMVRELGKQLSPDVFEKELSPETIALLDENIAITNWYPMWQFNEIQTFFWNHVSKRDPEAIRRGGADAFRNMQKTGRYQQLEFAGRAENADSK